MKPGRPASPEAYTLLARFSDVRNTLEGGCDREKLKRPLGYWALPRDRRLPYALLGRSLGELIRTPFNDISATPSIGAKKIASLVMLLERAARDAPNCEVAVKPPEVTTAAAHQFDADEVSESSWELWKSTVRRFRLEHESLGRLAPTLQSLPTVIWKTSLGRYLNLSLVEIRNLKTHGDKRVRAVLEVFYTLHRVLNGAECYGRVVIQPVPLFVIPIEQWIRIELSSPELPQHENLRQDLALPLLNQIEIDVGETVHRLAAGRLGIESAQEHVREQALRLEVTRARVYQLLELCSEVMDVRWPDGRWWLAELGKKLDQLDEEDPRVQLFNATWSLLYPDKVGHDLEVSELVLSQT